MLFAVLDARGFWCCYGVVQPPTGSSLSGNAFSPSPSAPLCWAFCLPPREPVGPAEFCVQGLRRSFQNQCFFWLWSPAGSQAYDRVVWPISALDFGWLPIPPFGSVRGGSQPLIQLRAHPGGFCLCSQAAGRLSGCPPTGVSGVGPRPLIGVRTHWGTLGLALRQLGHFSGLALTQGFRCGPLDARQPGFR